MVFFIAYVHCSTEDPHERMIDVRGDVDFFLDGTAGIKLVTSARKT